MSEQKNIKKKIAFAMVYGMTLKALALFLGLTIEETWNAVAKALEIPGGPEEDNA